MVQFPLFDRPHTLGGGKRRAGREVEKPSPLQPKVTQRKTMVDAATRRGHRGREDGPVNMVLFHLDISCVK